MATNKANARTLPGNPDAVPTQLGWVNHKTGELLVSIRGLTNAYKWDRPTNTFTRGGVSADFGGRGTAASRIETKAPSDVPSKAKQDEAKIVDTAITEQAKEDAKAAPVKKTTKRTTKKAAASKE